jgi:hypothetical protein
MLAIPCAEDDNGAGLPVGVWVFEKVAYSREDDLAGGVQNSGW